MSAGRAVSLLGDVTAGVAGGHGGHRVVPMGVTLSSTNVCSVLSELHTGAGPSHAGPTGCERGSRSLREANGARAGCIAAQQTPQLRASGRAPWLLQMVVTQGWHTHPGAGARCSAL